MLTSLPAYIHDHPHCVVFGDHQRSSRRNMNKVRSEEVTVQPQEYTAAAWHAAVLQDKPALFSIPGFDAERMKAALLRFALNDTHSYGTSGGGRAKLRQVFNSQSTKNKTRIEDGLYPEKTPPALPATSILQQACPPNCPLLLAWLQGKAYVDEHFSREDYDPETRGFIIATGDLTGIVGEQECYGVHCDKNGMRVGCHFDSFAAIAFLASGSKTFRTCAPTALAPKRDLNAHANERHDIDAAFCETATWYNIHMLPGHVMYLPMHWWHQVSTTALCCLPLPLCLRPVLHLGPMLPCIVHVGP